MKPLNERLAWLAGILDGEGSVSVRDKACGNKIYHVFKISIGNTDSVLLEEVCSVLNSIGVTYQITLRRWKNPKWRDMFYVLVCSRDVVFRLLELLLPWLTAKHTRAWLVLEVIRRLDVGEDVDRLVQEVRRLNKRGCVAGVYERAPVDVPSEDKRLQELSGVAWYGRTRIDADPNREPLAREGGVLL